LPKPDLVIFLESKVGELASRAEFGKERYESVAFQQQVAQVYSLLFDATYWAKFPAANSIEDLHASIISAIGTIETTCESKLTSLF
jgi:dTMP kinase